MDPQEEQTEAGIAERLDRIEAQLADFHRRSAHRETVIDRLHEENQQFRDGVRRVLFEPVVTDLLRLYDSMVREAVRRSAGDEPDALVASFADEVELAVERCGYEFFRAVPGEHYQAGRHAPAGTVATDERSRDNTVAEPLGAGLAEIESGRVRRPSRARFFRYQGVPLDQPVHSTEPAGRE